MWYVDEKSQKIGVLGLQPTSASQLDVLNYTSWSFSGRIWV